MLQASPGLFVSHKIFVGWEVQIKWKHVLVKKIFTNEVNFGLALQTWITKSIKWKYTDSSTKEKFRWQRSVKKVMLEVLPYL